MSSDAERLGAPPSTGTTVRALLPLSELDDATVGRVADAHRVTRSRWRRRRDTAAQPVTLTGKEGLQARGALDEEPREAGLL